MDERTVKTERFEIHGGVLQRTGGLDFGGPAILLIHGSESHRGWFAPLTKALVEKGWTVWTFDRAGWGDAPGKRGHLAHAEVALASLGSAVAFCRSKDRLERVLGMSWGGLLVAAWAARHRTPEVPVTLLVPGIFLKRRIRLRAIWRVLASGCHALLTWSPWNIKLPLDLEDFSENPDTRRWIAADHNRVTHVSPQFIRATLQLRKFVHKLQGQQIQVLLAEHDAITDGAATRRFFKRCDVGPVVAKTGATHALILDHAAWIAGEIPAPNHCSHSRKASSKMHLFDRLEMIESVVPFWTTFKHAAASRSQTHSIQLRLFKGKQFIAGGEVLPREYVTGETIASAWHTIERDFWPELKKVAFYADVDPTTSLEPLWSAADAARSPAAWSGLDTAACDAWMRQTGSRLPMVHHWQTKNLPPSIPPRLTAPVGLGMPTIWPQLLSWCGFRDFKIKLNHEEPVATCQNLIKLVGKNADVRVDANAAWTFAAFEELLPLLAAAGVTSVEEPCRREDRALVWRLAQDAPIPLVADESLCTLEDAQRLIHPNIRWNLRLGKNGGYTGFRALLRVAAENGIDVQLGCLVGESRILAHAAKNVLYWAPWRHLESSFPSLLLRPGAQVIKRRVILS